MREFQEKSIKSLKSMASKLQDSCGVLQEFGITSLGYSRFYTDKCIRISNNTEWMEYYLKNDIIYNNKDRYLGEINSVIEKRIYLVLRNQDTNSSEIKTIMSNHGMGNVCSLYLKNNDNYIEMFGFATDMDSENLTSFYINNIDILLKYTFFFKERMMEIINSKLAELFIPFDSPIHCPTKAPRDLRSELNDKLILKKIYLTEDISISPKEYECLGYLSQGNTYKGIANIMRISSRTVETHLNNIKRKVGYNYKADILKLLKYHPINYMNY